MSGKQVCERVMAERNAKEFLRQAETFRKLGDIIAEEGTLDAKLDGAIAYGLAEVCEGLAEIVRKEDR